MHVIPARRVAVSLVPPPDPIESAVARLNGGQSIVRCLAELAASRSGCVTRLELIALGLRPARIDAWVRRGRLIAVHRGVYAWGHRPRTYRAAWWAAVLAAGEGAKTSHGTAAAALGLLGTHRRVHVTAPTCHRRPGVAVHRAQTETVWVDDLPSTSVARTLVDLAGAVGHRVLESAVRQAQVRGLLDAEAIGEVLLDCPRPRGVRRLRAILEDPVAMAPTRSAPERAAIRAALAAGMPWPVVNGVVLDEEVDLHWPDRRLVVEVDGPTHDAPVQRARDRRRDGRLRAAGWRVVRIPSASSAHLPAAVTGKRSLDAAAS